MEEGKYFFVSCMTSLALVAWTSRSRVGATRTTDEKEVGLLSQSISFSSHCFLWIGFKGKLVTVCFLSILDQTGLDSKDVSPVRKGNFSTIEIGDSTRNIYIFSLSSIVFSLWLLDMYGLYAYSMNSLFFIPSLGSFLIQESHLFSNLGESFFFFPLSIYYCPPVRAYRVIISLS